MRRLNKEKSTPQEPLQSVYVTDLSWINPTTVLVEQLFSKCRHVLTFSRRRMLPQRLFQSIVFLKENSEYWNESVIQQMVAGEWGDRLGGEYDTDEEEDLDDEW